MTVAREDGASRPLERLTPFAVCPSCRQELTAGGGNQSLFCLDCGVEIRESAGILVGLLPGHPVNQESTSATDAGRGWGAGIAADMDQKATTYSLKYRTYSLASRGYILRRVLALQMAGPEPGRVLEAGCGPGVVGPVLRDFGADVHGVDLSREQLAAAYRDDPRGLYVQADLENLPYRTGIFDTVIMLGVFEYLERPDVVLGELRRVTRSGGRLIISLPNARSIPRQWTERVYIPATRALKQALGKPVPAYSRRLYSLGGIARMLEQAGFSKETDRFFDLLLVPPPVDRLAAGATLAFVDRLEHRSGRLLKVLVASQFIVEARA